jgi:exodeoxyribonuclease V alpha subunit
MNAIPSVTIRVTKVLATYKSGKMRFRGVPVCPSTHEKTSKRDFYFITTTPSQAVFEPEIGQVWKVNGEIYTEEKPSHLKYGIDRHHDIRKAKQCVCILPQTKEAFVAFIKEIDAFKGVGEGKAEDLWDEFKLETLKHMEHRRTKTLKRIVTAATAKSLVSGYGKYRNLKYATWLMSKEIPIDIQKMIFEFQPIVNPQRIHQSGYRYSIDPRTMIEENPYRLASCFSMKFSEVDQLVRSGFEPNINSADPRRMVAAVSEAIRTCNKGGHTVATYDKLLKQLIDILQKAESIANSSKAFCKPTFSIEALAINALKAHDKDAYVIYPDRQYQLTPTYLMENVIALRFLSMISQKVIFGEEESEALKKAFDLSPYPLLDQQKDAVVMAVESRISAIIGGGGTGKTTDSINKSNGEVVRERQINATSIYRFLHETIIEDGDGKYLVVIDEASMLDVPTMYHIIINIHPNVRILLVGDHHQLPPIGPGNVLADVVNSGVVPFTKLEIVKRQTGATGIPEYSKLVRKGLVPPKLTTGSIHFHEVATEEIAEKSAELYALSPSETMVVASTNALVKKVNELCQEAVNPNGQTFIVTEDDFLHEFYKNTLAKLRKNDPILFTENISVDVNNGSLGKLVSVERDKDTFGLVKMDDDDFDVIPNLEIIPALELGYTMTVHKAQGSQFPRVIVALQGGRIERSWLYTAITRAEVELHIVSTKQKLVEAIEKPPSASKRRTKLKALLQEGANKN